MQMEGEFKMIDMTKAIFSDDKTTFGIATNRGIYINTTGREIDPATIKPKTMRCIRCGKTYYGVKLATIPSPCECGSRGFKAVIAPDVEWPHVE